MPSAGARYDPPMNPAVRMTWSNLLFAHWPVDAAALRPLIPAELEIDTFDGVAWVALVPFQMTDTRFFGLPPMPGLSRFYECNVRTYVRCGPAAGVWFFSLDAEHLLPTIGGRQVWKLNYVHSRFNVSRVTGTTSYALERRRWGPWPAGHTKLRWSVGPRLPTAEPGSLEHFLTERYWLFTKKHGAIHAGRVAHEPWPLHEATLHELDDSLVKAGGVEVSGKPIVHASPKLVVDGFSLQRVAEV